MGVCSQELVVEGDRLIGVLLFFFFYGFSLLMEILAFPLSKDDTEDLSLAMLVAPEVSRAPRTSSQRGRR